MTGRFAKALVIAIYFFCVLSPGIGFFMGPSGPGRVIKLLANYWLGVTLYTALIVILADIIRVILKHSRKNHIGFPESPKNIYPDRSRMHNAHCLRVSLRDR